MLAVDPRKDLRGDGLDGGFVFAAVGHNDVGVALRRFDEAEEAGLDRGLPLADHRLHRPPALLDVAQNAAGEALVEIDVDEIPQVKHPPELLRPEDEDPVDGQDLPGLQGHRQISRVCCEIVLWYLDLVSGGEAADVHRQFVQSERIGVVEVDLGAILFGEVRQVSVVPVGRDIADRSLAQFFFDPRAHALGERALAGSRRPSESDDERFGILVFHS